MGVELTEKPKMTENYVKKNKIRLHLRKTRQRVIKNLKRDISKHADSREKNQKLLDEVKKAEIETVLHLVLTQNDEETKTNPENVSEGEQKELVVGLNNSLEKFRENREKAAKKKEKVKNK